ncbi:endonuclease [Flavobacterium coralii]|uniref:endonuclease n=1 Tax=Flavobacterium coralii TaxID=2838017 RepID=UPI0026BEDFF0|tara:strand:+ start:20341 stop:21426 length:1086 start_codon:yes stop_codon:yes gene_type:complete
MRKIYSLALGLIASVVFAQDGAPATPYYNGFNFNQSGMALKNALSTKITTTHINELSYSPGVWNALKVTDQDPDNPGFVLLLYGFSESVCPAGSSNDDDHRRRNANNNGGDPNCEWNREHVYPQSLGTPDLGQEGAGADAHHLRACDVDRNGQRGNKLYTTGSGNSGNSGSGWYPGDEWKGDVARILMYMYLRYPNQCVPTNAVMGNTVTSDPNMPAILLQWNAEDPVSEYEDNRNIYLNNANNAWGQGNRNPFIDNPYLATLIWGGPVAQDRWGINATDSFFEAKLTVYPNPAVNNEINIYSETTLEEIQLINLNGQLIQQIQKPKAVNNTYQLQNLPDGFYILKMTSGGQSAAKKIIVN